MALFLLFVRNRTEKLFNHFLFVFLFIVSHVILILLFFFFHHVVVLDEHVKVKTNHEEQTVGLLLLNYHVPSLFFSQNDGLLEVLFGVDEVFVDPDEIDFEELDGNLDLDFGEGALVAGDALSQCPEEGLLDPVEDINIPKVNNLDLVINQLPNLNPIRVIKLNNLFQQSITLIDLPLVIRFFNAFHS